MIPFLAKKCHDKLRIWLLKSVKVHPQPAFTCLKSTMETPERVKSVQS